MELPDNATLLRILELATTIKACDEKIRSLLSSGQIQIVYYSPRGQEIVAAALGTCLEASDYSVTTYRGLHDQIAKGVPLKPLLAELLGRASGTCKGKGGGMHVTHPPSGLMVTTGIVGGGLPIANGLALASQLRGEQNVTVCNFGDGASNIGGFHESLNMAALWRLPVVFCCQNNGFAEHTAYAAGTTVAWVADRGAAYSMPAVTVDGNNPVEMWSAAAEAVARARAGEGPTLLEAKTFRFMGHYFGDDSSYIPKAEFAAALAADPVPALRAKLLDDGVVAEEDLVAIEKRITEEVADAAEFAVEAPWPEIAELYKDVYAQEISA